MTAPSDLYRHQRRALAGLYADLADSDLATVVPGCPQWTVKDVLGHLAGVPVSVAAGDLEDAGQPTWTGRQVEAARGKPVGQLLEEWEAASAPFEPALDGMGFMGHVMVYDIAMHGDDVLEALGRPLGSSETHAFVLHGLVGRAGSRATGIGTLTLQAGDRSWTIGEGDPAATLTAPDEGELARVVGARRTDDQVRALTWSGDPEPWIPVLPLFRPGR